MSVPFDGATTNRPGARLGPRGVREASTGTRALNAATGIAPYDLAACADLGEIDGGRQTVVLRSPAVVTCDLRLNEPRYASLPAIMKAKKKTLEVLDGTTLGVATRTHTRLLGVQPPIQRTAGIRVQSVDELVSHLKQRAGVL